jgi:hypothetical protein
MTVKTEKADDDTDAFEALEAEAKEFNKVPLTSTAIENYDIDSIDRTRRLTVS